MSSKKIGLTAEQREGLIVCAEKEMREILEEISSLTSERNSLAEEGKLCHDDSADRSVFYAQIDRDLERANRRVQKLQHAISRFKNGFDGICRNCPDPIGYDRLCARPETGLCVSCRDEQDHVKSRRGKAPIRAYIT